MKNFKYLIQLNEGIHARPATIIVNEAKKYNSNITIKKGDHIVDCKRMIALMSLNAKKGDILEITIDGIDEDEAFVNLITVFKENI